MHAAAPWRPAAGAAVVLTVACMAFEGVLVSGAIGAVFMFMPLELMSESWRAAWDMIGQDTPAWAQLGFNLACWLASVLIGPFYVGAGFGLYLNRRTQMEAWDVEIALRRLRERLLPAASTLALLLLPCRWPPRQCMRRTRRQSLSRPTVPKRTRTVRKNPPLRPTIRPIRRR